MATSVSRRPAGSSAAPVVIDVTVWWMTKPQRKREMALLWFSRLPDPHPVMFRVLLSKYGKQGKLKVDLAYPLQLMMALGELGIRELHRTLVSAVAAALPDKTIAEWGWESVDTEYREARGVRG